MEGGRERKRTTRENSEVEKKAQVFPVLPSVLWLVKQNPTSNFFDHSQSRGSGVNDGWLQVKTATDINTSRISHLGFKPNLYFPAESARIFFNPGKMPYPLQKHQVMSHSTPLI